MAAEEGKGVLVDEDLWIVLDSKICRVASVFFEERRSDGEFVVRNYEEKEREGRKTVGSGGQGRGVVKCRYHGKGKGKGKKS